MTRTQWLWEFEALKQKEELEQKKTETLIKVFKAIMIKLLGLDVMSDKLANLDKDIEKQLDNYIPLSLLAGRREIVNTVMDKMQKEEDAIKALDDKNFEQMSAAIAMGDMEPILDEVQTISPEKMLELRREELERAGVKLVTESKPAPHISLPDRPKTKIIFDKE